ncbi:DUF6514 family protein [Clostridium minihomine]|uniref:DUF6514 family protein n=1 Tax=Clostridium minihomine TaxID=2045012 RepID=UPI000C75B065|nr:DUF6514 family protein [Clostridium minihomine]
MVENVGTIILSRQQRILEYYVFGSEAEGFGIKIVQRGSICLQAECENVAQSRDQAVALAKKLARGTVCPGHLCNILDDGDICC